MLRVKTCLAVVAVLSLWLGLSNLARAEDFPKGKFAITFDGMTISIKFDDKGKYRVYHENDVLVEGSYKITKDQIEFKDEKGPAVAPADVGKPGKYKWKFGDKKLTFSKIEDEVMNRSHALTAGPWAKE
ncbi:MAG TPA: hypothetical protein VKS79_17510 [Gemmataceae bacterium]|nr:hypothetical protein [Gemmataceae bacterium]